MAQLFANNASSTLASGINDTDNTIVLATGEGARFPAPTGGNYFLLTLTQATGLESSWEIVKCTARTTDTLTVTRAQESTTAVAWGAGAKAEMRVTGGSMPGATITAAATGFTATGGTTPKTLTVDDDLTASNVARRNAANTFTAQCTFTETADTVYTITDGAAFEIDPANGSVQVVTLGANRTPAATNFAAGQTVILGIDDGTAYSITWTTVAPTWVKAGGTGAAPTLATSGYTWVLLWKVGATMYAAEVGKP